MKVALAFIFVLVLVISGNARSPPKNNEPKILVMDVDAGADDAMAILTLLGMEALKQNPYQIKMITCVNGNTHLSNVVVNVGKTLKTAGRLDIPVFKGASASIMGESIADNFFGNDGFGDFEYPNPPNENEYIQEGTAAEALIKIVRENPGKVTLLAVGPLTNVALAIRLDDSFFSNLEELIIMGGSVKAVGNISPGIEFNARVDPEANKIILTTEPRPKITIVPWETAMNTNISMSWRKDILGQLPSNSMDLINKAEAVALSKSGDTWVSADTVAAVLAARRDSATEIQNEVVLAETGGEYSRGAFLVSYTAATSLEPNAQIVQSIDVEKFKNTLITYLG